MRLFVALDIPDETRSAIRGIILRLSPVVRGAKWAHADGIHVTLKFVGWIENEKVANVKGCLASVRPRAPIPVAFHNFGFFPNGKRPRVFWMGIESNTQLAELAAEIETQLAALEIPTERREFTPHLTLARFKTNEGVPQMQEMLGSMPQDFGAMNATEFHLYQSVLKSSGAIYSKLASYSFAQ